MRLRMVAPASAVNQSTDSISAYWPSRSVARSSAAAQEAGSDPVELPADRPDNAATQVKAAMHLKPFRQLWLYSCFRPTMTMYVVPKVFRHRATQVGAALHLKASQAVVALRLAEAYNDHVCCLNGSPPQGLPHDT